MADSLPQAAPELAALVTQLAQEQAKRKWAEMRVTQLEETLRLLRLKKYGPQSESLADVYLPLFDEEPGVSLDEVAAEASRPPLEETPRRKRKRHPGRQSLPADLPRVEKIVACPAAECQCGQCGAETVVIGYERSERLDVEPAKVFVTVTRREKRACRNCKGAGVVTAPVPAPIIDKGLASDRVVIDAVVSKYCDHLPLYRQSGMWLRDTGIELSRMTMSGWMMRVGDLLAPIISAMRREILQGNYIQADETTVPVQRPGEKKGKNHQAYLWQFGSPRGPGGREGPVVFRFDLGRSGAVPRAFLEGYSGLLQTDGYAGYNHVGEVGMVHAGCWAHARRFFIDALKVHPSDGLAADFVRRIDELFAVDRVAREKGLSPLERAELRREKSTQKVEELRRRLEEQQHRVLPKSKTGEGIGYALGQWTRLTRFLEYPELELSNNLAENSMRPAVLGRKNWIHVGSVEAGPRVSAILSVVESCRRMGIPVRQYLLSVLPGMADRKVAEVAELTPAAWWRRQKP
jgi:transposase